MSVWVKSRHGLTPDLRQLPPTRTFKKAPGEASPGASWIVNWVHPPIKRYSSRNLATQSCAVYGGDVSAA